MKYWLVLGTVVWTLINLTHPAWGQRTRTRSVEGPRGQRTIQVTQQYTSPGSFARNGSYEATGPNGRTLNGSLSGNGTFQRTEQGLSTSYRGSITTPTGSSLAVDRNNQVSGSRESGFQRETAATVTTANNEVVRSTATTATYDTTNGLSRETLITPAQGPARTSVINIEPLEPGLAEQTRTILDPSGNLLGTATTQLHYEFDPDTGWRWTETGATLIERSLTQEVN